MTTTEYQEMLTHALASIVRDLPQRRDWLDPDIERLARKILATPPPSSNLRDMREAPRTKPEQESFPILGYPAAHHIPLVMWRDEDWGGWSYADGVIYDDQLKGWLPLPEVSE